MANQTIDIEELLGSPDDPRFIAGIFNYCDRWCERCAFTDRCRLFADLRKQDEQHPERTLADHLHDNFRQTLALLNAWCERQGIDVAAVQQEADTDPEVQRELQRMDDTRSDPLQKAAEAYSTAAYRMTQAMEHATRFETFSEPVRDAIDTIRTYTISVSSKIHRALSGLAARDTFEEDPVQNDWNGSAKVARLIVARSTAAWQRLIDAGQAPPDAPIRQMPGLLDRIDRDLARRFPRAMDFVRPGFDDAPGG